MPRTIPVREHDRGLAYFKKLKATRNKSLLGFESIGTLRVREEPKFWTDNSPGFRQYRITGFNNMTRDNFIEEIFKLYRTIPNQEFPSTKSEIIDANERYYVVTTDVGMTNTVSTFNFYAYRDKVFNNFVVKPSYITDKHVKTIIHRMVIVYKNSTSQNNLTITFTYNNPKLFRILKKYGFVGTTIENASLFVLDLTKYKADTSFDDDSTPDNIYRDEAVI